MIKLRRTAGWWGVRVWSVGRLYKRNCNVPAGYLIGQFPLRLFIRFNKGPESVFSRLCKTTGENRQEYLSVEIDLHWVLCSSLNNFIYRLSICDSNLNLTFPLTVASSVGVFWLIFDKNFSYRMWQSWFLNYLDKIIQIIYRIFCQIRRYKWQDHPKINKIYLMM